MVIQKFPLKQRSTACPSTEARVLRCFRGDDWPRRGTTFPMQTEGVHSLANHVYKFLFANSNKVASPYFNGFALAHA